VDPVSPDDLVGTSVIGVGVNPRSSIAVSVKNQMKWGLKDSHLTRAIALSRAPP